MSDVKEQPGQIRSQNGDPTANVQNIVAEVVRRIDDLREAETRRVDQLVEGVKELMLAESKRIDAIRLVDTQSVQIANEKATAQATVLANNVSTSADTLRALVASTAASVALQLDQLTKQLTDRLALLEKSQYEGVGKERITDPQFSQLLIEMKATRDSISQGTGRGAGLNQGWVILLGIAGLGGAIIGIISFFR